MSSAGGALAMMVVPAILSNVYLGTAIATSHRLVGLQMRATASAILFFVINIIGLGGGPWVVGMVSDALAAQHGVESLRLAMLYVLPPVMLWSGFHFLCAARTLKQDIARAPA